MKALLAPLRVRPRLLAATATGVVVALLLPGTLHGVTRGLLGWNAAVWLYLLLVWANMSRLDHGRLRQLAAAQAESAGVVLLIAICATLVSLGAIFVELAAAKAASGALGWPNLLLAVTTLIGSWLLLPTEFALSYASRYFGGQATPGRPKSMTPPLGGDAEGVSGVHQDCGMNFPGMDEQAGGAAAPNYVDFLYFSITVAATAQTSDVAVTTRAMRRLVMLQSVLSFAFNALVLALAINMAASLF